MLLEELTFVNKDFIFTLIVILFIFIISMYHIDNYLLIIQINKMEKKVDSVLQLAEHSKLLFNDSACVTLTVYEPVASQTDTTPHITADGTIFNVDKAGEYKYVALSRNLLSAFGGKFDYGDKIWIYGTKEEIYDGVYTVRDTMNSRFVNYVDILIDINGDHFKQTNIHLYKLPIYVLNQK